MTGPKALETDVVHVDFSEVGGGTLPDYLVGGVATDVIRKLVRAGIDPNTVYFRGREGQVAEDIRQAHYDGLEGEELDSVDDYGIRASDEIADREAQKDPYGYILGEEQARRLAREEALGRQIDGPPNPAYTLAPMDSLLDPTDSDNPIYAAGVQEQDEEHPGSGSFLDIYDAALINSLQPDFNTRADRLYSRTVLIPEEQLSLAALAIVRLNYRIVNDGE